MAGHLGASKKVILSTLGWCGDSKIFAPPLISKLSADDVCNSVAHNPLISKPRQTTRLSLNFENPATTFLFLESSSPEKGHSLEMPQAKSKNTVGLGNTLMNDRFGKGKGSDRRKGAAVTRVNHATGEQVRLSPCYGQSCLANVFRTVHNKRP